MKKFFLEHPYSTGFFIFLLIMLGGETFGLIAANTFINPDLRIPPDPRNHHGNMGAGILMTLALGASLIFGILSGLITT